MAEEVWVVENLGWPEEVDTSGVFSSADGAIAAASRWIERPAGSNSARRVTTIDREAGEVTINDDHGGGYRAVRFVVDAAVGGTQ